MGAVGASEPIDLEARAGGPVEPPRRPLLPVLLALAAVVAVIAAVVLTADDDVEVAVDQDETTTTTEAHGRTPDLGSFPRPVALGGRTDGKDSVGLPVKAEPSTGLVDGQEVTVTGTGFPPGVSVGVVMCTKEAGRDHGARGVDACNIGHFAQAETNRDGVAVATFSVRRLVVLDGVEVDCASEAQRCLIGMGMMSDYDTSGGVLVDFDGTVSLPDPPTATVQPSTGLVDGQEVTVTVTGLVPDSPVGAVLCRTVDGTCIEPPAHHSADAAGVASFPMRAWRAFGVATWEPGRPAPNVDCAIEPCHVQVWGEGAGGRAVPVVGVSFAGGSIDRSAPALVMPSTGPFRPGDELVVELPDLDHDAGVEPTLCSDQGCSGGMLAPELLEGVGQRIRVQVPSVDEGNTCIDRPCWLVVHLYPPMVGEAPPPLFPDPVPVTIEP